MLTGKNVLITGISGGIGLAAAKRFLAAGARVCGSYRTWKPCLEELGPEAVLFQMDTENLDEISGILKAQIRAFGGIDVLVNCIGITHPEPLFSANASAWENVVKSNLFSAMRITQAAIIPLVSRKKGAIIHISSIFGSVGGAGQSSYCASKAGLDAMTRALSLELAGKNIRVNTVAPGYIETEMTKSFTPDQRRECEEMVPMKRFGKPEEVAALCEFLASDDAAYITGQTFVIDGGLSAH